MAGVMFRIALLASPLIGAGATSRKLLRGISEGVAPPDLPPVAKMMNASSKTLVRMSKQLSDLGTKVADAARDQREQLSKKKEQYQQRLNSGSATNDKLKLQNKRLSAQIWDLEKGNHELREKAVSVQKDNAELRKAFDTVVLKAQAAESFVNVSLASTDDSHDASLKVISVDDALVDDDKDVASVTADNSDDAVSLDGSDAATDASSDNTTATDDDGAALFLEVRAHHQRAWRHDGTIAEKVDSDDSEEETDQDGSDADDSSELEEGEEEEALASSDNSTKAPQAAAASSNLITSLQKELQQLAQQDAASSKEMDRLFQAQLNKLTTDRSKILKDQKALNHTHLSLASTQTKLKLALLHLDRTKSSLQTQIRGLGHYLQTLAGFVLKPSVEAEKQIPSLTNNVAGFVETQSWVTELAQEETPKMSKHTHLEVTPQL